MTEPNNQQAEFQKETQRLRKEKEALKRELDALTASVADCKAKLDAAGADLGIWQHRQASAGEWSRHFSTVRMTVTPFLFTTSLAVLAFKWDDGEPIFITAASVTWAAGMFLLSSSRTSRTRRPRRKITTILSCRGGPAEKKRWGSHTGWPWNWWRRNWLLDMGLVTGVALTFCFHHGNWSLAREDAGDEESSGDAADASGGSAFDAAGDQDPAADDFPARAVDVPTTLPSIGVTGPTSESPSGHLTTQTAN